MLIISPHFSKAGNEYYTTTAFSVTVSYIQWSANLGLYSAVKINVIHHI
ncbi:hypothetical protein CRENPOLYSF2_170019 [Crenothrix polyspora]|uniref:Uncharacterized protein n=1 Tax=Crenothrix polyspora TaxID=360316 RepID=A0A1R4H2Z0_9GAMM|nr:hypothetical protein CRENPOLYSF2_170019 [Crenothrix polyspora]